MPFLFGTSAKGNSIGLENYLRANEENQDEKRNFVITKKAEPGGHENE